MLYLYVKASNIVRNSTIYSLPGMILLYLAAPFHTEGIFA